jgi:hypothetical protein
VEERVSSPSLRREAGLVARAMFHVVFWSAFVMFGHAPSAGADAAALPFETRFSTLDAADQRMFRLVQEGIVEAEARRGRTGSWPTPEALAEAGVPPFAKDPIDRAGYTWRVATARGLVNYVGEPRAGSGRRPFQVVVTEPVPGTPPDPQVKEDEIHHRLADGTMIHVGTWMGPSLEGVRLPTASPSPDQGFRQVLVGPVRR